MPKELVDIYRDEVLPLASVLTPNQFEAEQLTQRPIRSEADAVAACEALHARGPRTVLLTSIDLPTGEAAGEVAGGAAGEAAGRVGPQRVMMLASTRDGDGVLKQWRLRLPRLDQVLSARARARARARCSVPALAPGPGPGPGSG